MKWNNLYIFLVVLFVIAGCRKSNFINFAKHDFQGLQTAKFFDIPLPLNYTVLKSNQNDSFFKISSDETIDDLNNLYKEEMCNFGWKLVNTFQDSEVNLIFEKPHKYILISIRPYKNQNKSEINFFIKVKDEKAS